MNARTIFYIILAGIGYGCWLILKPLFSSILWAGIITFATWPFYIFFRHYIGKICASFLMTVLCTLSIVMPIAILTSTLINDAPTILHHLSSTHLSINFTTPPQLFTEIPFLNKYLVRIWEQGSEYLINLEYNIRPYLYGILRTSISMFLQTIGSVLQFAFALFISFFFWMNGEHLGNLILKLLNKIAGSSAKHLVNMTTKTILGTVYGIIGTAILQGILTGCGLALFSIPEPILLGGIAAFLSLFPIGAPVVWIPAAIWLGLNHHILAAILFGLYGIIIISGVEHVIRPIFISRGNQLPYILSVLGILGGILAFGGLGIFLGPVLLGLGYTLILEFSSNHLQN